MPNPKDFETEKDFMAACIPVRIKEGDEQDQAVAVCMGMWKDKDKKSADVLEDEIKVGRVLAQRNIDRINNAIAALQEALAEVIKPEADETLPGVVGEMLGATQSLSDVSVFYGGEVKSLGDGRVGGYLVRFSTEQDPDISDARDFFTSETDFLTEFPRKSPAWFNHALDARKKRLSHDATLSQDDFGIFAETILDERDRYEKFLLDLADAGKLGWSSGTAAHLVEREQVGEAHRVKQWPLGLDASLTHIPAEPRNEVIPLKSLSELLPPIPEPEGAPEADKPAEREGEDKADATINPNQGGITMELTEEKLTEIIQAAVKNGAEQALKALPAKPEARVVEDEADRAIKAWKPGEFFRAVKSAALDPMHEDPRLRALKYVETKATGMSEGVPADGGYLIPQQMAGGIIDHMLEPNSLYARVSRDSLQGNNMSYNGIDETTHVGSLFGGVICYWGSEGGTYTSTHPLFYQVELKLKKIYALVYATDEQLEDTQALEGWIGRNVPAALLWNVESALVSGNGAGKPQGVTQSPALINQVRLNANELNDEDFFAMWARRYLGARDYIWLVNPSCTPSMAVMAVGNIPVYLPAGSIANQPYGRILGADVIETEHVAAWKSAGDVLLVSPSQYQMIDKAGGIQSASSIHVAFTTGEQAFRFTYRCDGQSIWHSAVTPENGSTFSPFVSLAAASS